MWDISIRVQWRVCKAQLLSAPMAWPETEPVALRFILDYSLDLRGVNPQDPALATGRGTDRADPAQVAALPCPIDAGLAHCVLAGVSPDEEPRLSI
jgi:hypothetical protein